MLNCWRLQQCHQVSGNNAQQDLDNIFTESGFRKGMRQMAKELIRSGGDTDL